MSRVDNEPAPKPPVWELPLSAKLSSSISTLVVASLNGAAIDPDKPPYTGPGKGSMVSGVVFEADMVQGLNSIVFYLVFWKRGLFVVFFFQYRKM